MKQSRPILSGDTKKEKLFGVHYTTNHSGKMSGLFSLSTSVLTNPHCVERMKNKDSICAKCFAVAQMNCYKQMNECFSRNAEILCSGIIPDENIPVIPTNKFRFESFGDLQSVYQVINYFKIARMNPDVKCALWTKNLWYVKEAIENGYAKPKNLQIVFSSPIVNKPIQVVPDFVDKVFTVYTKDFISENEVNINCGAKSCMTCGRCYKKSKGLEFINEILK